MARLFKRGTQRLTEPAKYIQASDSVSRPLSVLLTLALLCAGIAIIVGIFFGGKWAVDRIGGEPTAAKPPATSQAKGSKPEQGASGTKPTSSPSTTTPTATGGTTAPPTVRQPSTTTSALRQTAPIPGTGASNLPNTGPQPE